MSNAAGRRGEGLWRRLSVAVCAALALAAVPAATAHGRQGYVVSEKAGTVSAFDTSTGALLGAPIPAGSTPAAIAISPDGKTAYVADYLTKGKLVEIDVASGQPVGEPIPVGADPVALAVSPDGAMVYVVDAVEAGRVTVIDARTGQQVGKPIPVGKYPFGIAISPDGRTAYVSNFESPSVSVIDLLTLTVSQTIKAGIGEGPRGVAITPDGRFAYVANENSEFISVIDTHSNSALSPQIPVGLATQIAISPDGGTGYVTNYASRRISTFSVQANTPGPVIPASGLRPYYVAVSPDGGSMFFSSYEPSRLYRVSTQGNIVGQPATVGEGAAGVAIVPDQPPTAAFSLMQSRVRPGVPASFDASASSDSDGTISSYAWAFGDGVSASSAAPIFTHTFAKPGTYASTLRVTDNEGCSTRFVFTGQTASCNGSPLASHTANVNVTYPGVRLACPKTARPAGCRYRLVVVSSKPPARGAHGSRKGKIEARPLTAELKAGKKKIVSFMPKPKFAARLATAGKVLVKETTTIARKHKVAYRRLRIVQ